MVVPGPVPYSRDVTRPGWGLAFYSIKGLFAPFTGALPVVLLRVVLVALDLVESGLIAEAFAAVESGLVAEPFVVVADAFVC